MEYHLPPFQNHFLNNLLVLVLINLLILTCADLLGLNRSLCQTNPFMTLTQFHQVFFLYSSGFMNEILSQLLENQSKQQKRSDDLKSFEASFNNQIYDNFQFKIWVQSPAVLNAQSPAVLGASMSQPKRLVTLVASSRLDSNPSLLKVDTLGLVFVPSPVAAKPASDVVGVVMEENKTISSSHLTTSGGPSISSPLINIFTKCKNLWTSKVTASVSLYHHKLELSGMDVIYGIVLINGQERGCLLYPLNLKDADGLETKLRDISTEFVEKRRGLMLTSIYSSCKSNHGLLETILYTLKDKI